MDQVGIGLYGQNKNWDGWQLPVISVVVLLPGGLDALVGTGVNVETMDKRNIIGKMWCLCDETNINS